MKYFIYTKFIFLDTFKLLDDDNDEIKINEKGITWSDDVGNKFKRTKNSQDEQWIDPEDGFNKIYLYKTFLSKNILLSG